jgi:hypothetical protein
MRINKPDIGFQNMRKLTNIEAKLLGLDRKINLKLRIMTSESGKVTFWLCNTKSNDLTEFTGPSDEYFDGNLANIKLENHWARNK